LLAEINTLSIEAIAERHCWAIHSADLGTSSKESFWDFNKTIYLGVWIYSFS